MKVGVPREVMESEYRVAITPVGVREFANEGHDVLIERDAGAGSAIPDVSFERAGAKLVRSAEDVWGDAELVLKVKEPQPSEFALMREGQILFTYLHLAAHRDVTDALTKARTTAIAYETVESPDGRLPLLAPMSEIAGRMAPHVSAHFLERAQGGRGVLLSGVSGVHPARVCVIGAGMAGMNAAWIAQGMEAEVVLIDKNVERLRYVDHIHKGRILTLSSATLVIEEQTALADVLIGAVLVPGALAPKLITVEMIGRMRPGSVFVDISIDQGGSSETSHVTTHTHPTYVTHGVVHYCVGNMPGAVPHTSTYALTNATLPYAMALAEKGLVEAIHSDPALAKGVNVHEGRVTNRPVAEAHGFGFTPLSDLVPLGS
ncbi:MAG: alanine dehydrogenase [Actinobacteria bacterium]|nr:MAG: alanine dehydrogenase [Actinomycetota bacterium]